MSDPEWTGFRDDEQSEDEETEFERKWAGRDSIIFLIDCSNSMFSTKTDDTPFNLTFQCVFSCIRNKIISSEKDLSGIVLFGTKKDNNTGNFKNVYVLQELKQPGAPEVLKIQEITDITKDKFNDEYGISEDYSLSDALWNCSLMFSASKVSLESKRILLFTNTDNPHDSNLHIQQQARSKAKDLSDNGVEIIILPLQPDSDADFDMDKFYQSIRFVDEDEDKGTYNAAEKFEELTQRIRSKDHKKRAVVHLNWTIGEDVSIGIGVYNLVRPLHVTYPIRLSENKQEELRTVSKTYLQETGEILLPSDLNMYQEYAGRKIYFDPDEVTQLKKFGDPGLVLLGFKKSSFVQYKYYVKPSHFIYPDESRCKGSICLFAALLKKCQDRDVVALCRFIPRNNTPPRVVALIPQEEVVNSMGVQETPPGFHLVYLPFSDDIRHFELPENLPKANEKQIDKAKDIVKKLKFTFQSENFENPVIQTHWRNIEAVALQFTEDDLEPIQDCTIPNYSAMEKLAYKVIEDFKSSIADGFDQVIASGGTVKKQKGTTVAAEKETVSDADIKKAAETGKLNKYTLNVLKAFCQRNGIRCSGQKKSALVEEIEEYFENN